MTHNTKIIIKKLKFLKPIFLALSLFLCFFLNLKFNSSALGDSKYTLNAGKTLYLKLKTNENETIFWSSSDASVAEVDQRGFVYGVRPGVVIVKATDTVTATEFLYNINITDYELNRINYFTPNNPNIHEDIIFTAVTAKNVESVKFDIYKNNIHIKTILANKKLEREYTYVWENSSKMIEPGEYIVKTVIFANGQFFTFENLNLNLMISTNKNSSEPSIEKKSISEKCIKFIMSCEGFRTQIYKDLADIYTIGYGMRIYENNTFYNNLTHEELIGNFKKTINNSRLFKTLNNFLLNNNILFSQNHIDALFSFSYNLGSNWLINGSDLSKILLGSCENNNKKMVGIVKSSNGINLRNRPSVKSKKILGIPNNTKLEILNNNQENKQWVLVKTPSGKVGYCFSKYVSIQIIDNSFKNLDFIDKNLFIKEFLLYHHIKKKCIPSLIFRRFQELDIFFSINYNTFKGPHYINKNYPWPECYINTKNN